MMIPRLLRLKADYLILHKLAIVEQAASLPLQILTPLTLNKTHQFLLSQYMTRVLHARNKTLLRKRLLSLPQAIQSVLTEDTTLSMSRTEPLSPLE